MLCDGIHPLFDVTPLGQLGDAGDLPLPNTSLAAMREAMAPVDRAVARASTTWSGSVAITRSRCRCCAPTARSSGGRLAVLHFDAHCDTWTDHFGEPSGHGTWVYEAMQEGLVVKECFMQLGIRSPANAQRTRVRARPGRPDLHRARAARPRKPAATRAPCSTRLRARLAAHGTPPLYVSLDIDCLDPAFAPGTGTPEPGGMTTNQVLSRARRPARHRLRRHGLRRSGAALRPRRADQLWQRPASSGPTCAAASRRRRR